ncbi:MAG: MBL fold metallo-hydrolase [Candidatus Njordarchaeota archaeon]
MLIRYWGHSCFEIFPAEKIENSIIFDPFSEDTGGFLLDTKSWLILCSHDHFDHNAWKRVSRQNSKYFLDFVGETKIDSIKIKGVRLYHDPNEGALRGKISVYVLKVEDFIVTHLGDLGHLLNEDQTQNLLSEGKIDILFIPVGGIFTIGPEQAITVIHQLNPSIAIPMHFKHPKHNMRIFGRLKSIEEFMKYAEKSFEIKFVGNSIDIKSKMDIPRETAIYVMSV